MSSYSFIIQFLTFPLMNFDRVRLRGHQRVQKDLLKEMGYNLILMDRFIFLNHLHLEFFLHDICIVHFFFFGNNVVICSLMTTLFMFCWNSLLIKVLFHKVWTMVTLRYSLAILPPELKYVYVVLAIDWLRSSPFCSKNKST